MRKASIILGTIAIVMITFFACQKHENITPVKSNENIVTEGEDLLNSRAGDDNPQGTSNRVGGGPSNDPPVPQKIVIRFSKGLPDTENSGGRPCTGGGECGPCPGICLVIEFEVSGGPITQLEIQRGLVRADAEVVNHNKLHMAFKGDGIDNGNGFVDIKRNYFVGHSVSNALGYNMVMIKKGLYPMDYSDNQFGEAVFDVMAN